MTCNQLIVLLDCYRGFDRSRHMGTVDRDCAVLVRSGLIERSDTVSSFEFRLTEAGTELAATVLCSTQET